MSPLLHAMISLGRQGSKYVHLRIGIGSMHELLNMFAQWFSHATGNLDGSQKEHVCMPEMSRQECPGSSRIGADCS